MKNAAECLQMAMLSASDSYSTTEFDMCAESLTEVDMHNVIPLEDALNFFEFAA